MDQFSILSNKIHAKKAKVAVIGTGYVGGTLAKEIASAQFQTLGFDLDKKKVAEINNLNIKNLTAHIKKNLLVECDIICICVPTPINKDYSPNLKLLINTINQVSYYLHKGMLVIVESSVRPGTTRGTVLPILQQSKLVAGKDFFLCFSPERIDPGNKKFTLRNTPKIVSGMDKNSLKLATQFYSNFIEKVIPVSSLETAEMTKILENVFRFVNISLINEIAEYTKKLGVNIWEIIDAASTKPYGFLAHYPGPGIGGDCIPALSYYLLDSAKRNNTLLRIVKAAAEINEIQPKKVVALAEEVLNGNKSKNGSKSEVLLIGVAYKSGVADIRESATLKIWGMLEKRGYLVSYHDPYVSRVNGFSSKSLNSENLAGKDLIIITTAHKNIPYQMLVDSETPLIDTRNTLQGVVKANIFRL